MIGVIGGSGFYSFFGSDARSLNLDTPYGEPSAPITVGRVGTHEVAFLPRHGLSHQYSPHTVPYRANMWALRALGVRRVFGPCAVGSLTPELGPGAIVVPDQLVDRTRDRGDTYFDSGGIHVGFADPYCPTLRAAATGLPGVVDGGTMVVVQGPRFSTRAESNWFAREGFTLINMTGYPEAVLARELEMCYAAIALVTDLDAGIVDETVLASRHPVFQEPGVFAHLVARDEFRLGVIGGVGDIQIAAVPAERPMGNSRMM